MRRFLFVVSLLAAQVANAGKLDKFEESASKPQTQSSDKSSSQSSRSSGSSSSSFGEALAEAILGPIVEGAVEVIIKPVLEKTVGVVVEGTVTVLETGIEGSFQKSKKRLLNDAEIPDLSEDAEVESDFGAPLLLVDIGYGAGTNIQWSDIRAEAGVGPFGVFYRQSQYIEPSADDDLEITNFGFNYRLLYKNRTEITFGVGSYQLDGNKTHKSGSLQFGVNHQLKENLSFDYSRVSVSGKNLNLADSEYALMYGKDHWFIRAFYRSMDTSNTSLDGIGMGITVVY